VLITASLAKPEIGHAPLVDIPRNPGSYEVCAAIGTVVKYLFIHAAEHPVPIARPLGGRGGLSCVSHECYVVEIDGIK
jgi:hypothetical protein